VVRLNGQVIIRGDVREVVREVICCCNGASVRANWFIAAIGEARSIPPHNGVTVPGIALLSGVGNSARVFKQQQTMINQRPNFLIAQTHDHTNSIIETINFFK
jgi:hypothetical protein